MNSNVAQPNRQLIVGIGFESLFDLSVDWFQTRENFARAGVTGFTLSAGRTEWLAFLWEGHSDRWSWQARDYGGDRIAEIIAFLTADSPRSVALVIDALSPLDIARDPTNGGSFADGTTSTEFPSATSLSTGPQGQRITELAEELARRYKPHRIELTELIGDSFFGDMDENLYQRSTGSAGFPRRSDGSIDITNPGLCTWQADIIIDIATRCVEVTAPQGVGFGVDVRANWHSPGADRSDSGHAYGALLGIGSSLTIWVYFGIENLPASITAELMTGLTSRFSSEQLKKIMLSIGLWGRDDHSVSPVELSRALAITGDLVASITPLSLISPQHWDAIEIPMRDK